MGMINREFRVTVSLAVVQRKMESWKDPQESSAAFKCFVSQGREYLLVHYIILSIFLYVWNIWLLLKG